MVVQYLWLKGEMYYFNRFVSKDMQVKYNADLLKGPLTFVHVNNSAL
jgi:hypothetical protein